MVPGANNNRKRPSTCGALTDPRVWAQPQAPPLLALQLKLPAQRQLRLLLPLRLPQAERHRLWLRGQAGQRRQLLRHCAAALQGCRRQRQLGRLQEPLVLSPAGRATSLDASAAPRRCCKETNEDLTLSSELRFRVQF